MGECVNRIGKERTRANAAKAFLESALHNKGVVLKNIRFGKYAGRVVAKVETQTGQDYAAQIIHAGYGEVYTKGKRRNWCVRSQSLTRN